MKVDRKIDLRIIHHKGLFNQSSRWKSVEQRDSVDLLPVKRKTLLGNIKIFLNYLLSKVNLLGH